MELTKKELSIIEDTDFLLTKYTLLGKIDNLLISTRDEIYNLINKSNFDFPKEMNLGTGKISKGENYKCLPYFVLDYPAYFSNENIFAYRTMFWWGNFFSSTIHLQGKFLKKYRKNITDNFKYLLNKNIFICIGKTPWEYHYEQDNYVLLEQKHSELIGNYEFLKLSKKLELKDWEKLPQFSSDFLELILTFFSL